MFVIGLAVAAPVGAMALVCVDRTLHRGWRSGFATGLGIATADAVYAATAAFGVSAISALLVSWQTPLRVVGGVALVLLGVRSAIARPVTQPSRPEAASTPEGAGAHKGDFASALALTLTNPMTIIAFTAIFVSAGIAVSPSVGQAVLATLGVAAGSLTWWIALVTATVVLGKGAGPGARLWLGRLSGIAVAAFGVYAAVGTLFTS